MNNLAETYAALGRHADAVKLHEETLAPRNTKLGPAPRRTLRSIAKLANLPNSYIAVGRTRNALPLLEEAGIDYPRDTAISRMIAALQAMTIREIRTLIAALQAWFGEHAAYVATRQRIVAVAKGTDSAVTARRAAQAGALRPSTDNAELEALLALGRKAVELSGDEWELLALGMVEYRYGHFAAADAALINAANAGKNNPHVTGTSAFYRAMSLFRQGKEDEARKVAAEAAAKMKPLPKDKKNPLAGGADHRGLDPLDGLHGSQGADQV